MRLSNSVIDVARLEQGDWITDIPEMDDLRLKVRGIGNADYRRLQTTLMRALPRASRQRGQISPEDAHTIDSKCLIQTVLIDWDNLTDDDGNQIPYSPDFAAKLIMDPAYDRFRSAVVWAATVVADADDVDEEIAAKN